MKNARGQLRATRSGRLLRECRSNFAIYVAAFRPAKEARKMVPHSGPHGRYCAVHSLEQLSMSRGGCSDRNYPWVLRGRRVGVNSNSIGIQPGSLRGATPNNFQSSSRGEGLPCLELYRRCELARQLACASQLLHVTPVRPRFRLRF